MAWRPARQIAHEGAWVALGQVASILGTLASIRLMTEVLPPQEFGRFTLLVGVAALALGLTASPILQAILRFYPDCARINEVRSLRHLGSEKIRSSVLIAAAVISVGWTIASKQASVGQWFIGVFIAALLTVDALRSFELAMLNAARRQREAALLSAADAWLRPLLAFFAVGIFGASASAALAGYILGSAAAILAMRLIGQLEARNISAVEAPATADRLFSRDELAVGIQQYSWPLVPLAIAGWLSGMGDRYVIGGLLGLEQAGLYSAAYGLASRPFISMFAVIELTMRPILQNAIAAGDTMLISRTQRTFLVFTLIGSGGGVLCFMFLSKYVAYLLLAPEYRGVARLMPWIALGYALYAISCAYTRFCYAFDRTKAVLCITAIGTLTGFLVLLPAVKIGGLIGATLAVPVQFAIQLGLAYILAKRASAPRSALSTGEQSLAKVKYDS